MKHTAMQRPTGQCVHGTAHDMALGMLIVSESVDAWLVGGHNKVSDVSQDKFHLKSLQPGSVSLGITLKPTAFNK
jgi:hypothetical protein